MPYVELLERAMREPIRAVIAAPPQHAKTSTTIHALVRGMRVRPGSRNAYATYNAKRSASVESGARLVAERDSLDLKFRQDSWLDRTTGGSILWASRKGGLTGEPVDGLLVVDDIIKDREEANSATTRDATGDWFDEVAEPRCHRCASILVMATRWHPDDLSGRLIRRGWQYLNLCGLADGEVDDSGIVIGDPMGRRHGEALWPERMTAPELLSKQRANPWSFAALYQGRPRPKGGTVFGDPTYYDALPDSGYRVAYGMDLAISEKTHADWSVLVELWVCGKNVYLVDVLRKQVQAPEFTLAVSNKITRRKGAIRWYTGPTEAGIAQFMRKKLPMLKGRPATRDKLQRAQPMAEAWNSGLFMVPSRAALTRYGDVRVSGNTDAPMADDDELPDWLVNFTDEIAEFTGLQGGHDDQVDAAAAGFDELSRKNPMLEALQNRQGTS